MVLLELILSPPRRAVLELEAILYSDPGPLVCKFPRTSSIDYWDLLAV